VEAHNGLGVALVYRGDIKGAIGHFREALRLDPSHAGVRANLERLEAMKDGLDD
jgi:Flp pilus assembly protein TadD